MTSYLPDRISGCMRTNSFLLEGECTPGLTKKNRDTFFFRGVLFFVNRAHCSFMRGVLCHQVFYMLSHACANDAYFSCRLRTS